MTANRRAEIAKILAACLRAGRPPKTQNECCALAANATLKFDQTSLDRHGGARAPQSNLQKDKRAMKSAAVPGLIAEPDLALSPVRIDDLGVEARDIIWLEQSRRERQDCRRQSARRQPAEDPERMLRASSLGHPQARSNSSHWSVFAPLPVKMAVPVGGSRARTNRRGREALRAVCRLAGEPHALPVRGLYNFQGHA